MLGRLCSTTLIAESQEELESLDEGERDWKSWLKTQLSENKDLISGPITSWQIDGGKNGNSDRFYFLDSKVTADYDCSHGIKRCLLLGRKAMTILDSILKSRDVTLLTKVRLVKAMVFPVVMYGRESWTIKKAEHWRTDAFQLRCWRRLENSLDSKEIKPVNPKDNQPWIFIGRTDAEAETPLLWPLDGTSWLSGKDWCWQRFTGKGATGMRWLDGTIDSMSKSLNKLGDSEGQGSQVCCSPWGFKESYMTEQLNNNVITCDWGDSFISPYCVPGMC